MNSQPATAGPVVYAQRRMNTPYAQRIQFRTDRKNFAHTVAREALRQKLISRGAQDFYDDVLVPGAGNNHCLWRRQTTMAEDFNCSDRQVRRYLKQLEAAGLVRIGKNNKGHRTDDVYLSAYVDPSPYAEEREQPLTYEELCAAAVQANTEERTLHAAALKEQAQKRQLDLGLPPANILSVSTPEITKPAVVPDQVLQSPVIASHLDSGDKPADAQTATALFFVADEVDHNVQLMRTSESSHNRTSTSTPTVKAEKEIPDSTNSVCGGEEGFVGTDATAADEAKQRLEAAGCLSRVDIACVANQRPLAQVVDVIAYVEWMKVRGQEVRPGLIIHMLKENQWPASHKVAHVASPASKPPQSEDDSTSSEYPKVGDFTCTDPVYQEQRSAWDELWHTVISALKDDLPPNEWETWIKPTKLLELEDGRALVGAPNIFVRQELEGCYLAKLCAALAVQEGRDFAIQIVIDRS